MHEIEIKFQIPDGERAALDRAVAGRTPPRRTRLQAVYWDTPERALAQAKLALRLRREGRQWVQTLKGATDDGMTRLEHNVALGSGPEPAVDPARHAGTPAGDRLRAVLGAAGDASLVAVYRTDILRRTRVERTRLGRVELAFDEGCIEAGESRLAVCELEVEGLGVSRGVVIDAARRWVARFGLWLDLRSKSERGDLLARGIGMAPARIATTLKLSAGMSDDEALRRVLANCAEQILGNASQIGSGEHDDEHVHQLRVGLRRLRSALQLFAGTALAAEIEPALANGAATLFRRLGAARDQFVTEAGFAVDLRAALQAAGVAGEAPAIGVAGSAEAPAAMLRDAASQTLLLNLLAATHEDDAAGAGDAVPPPPPPPLRKRIAARLDRWHHRAAADAKRYGALDDAGRHRLRKRIKRLRYALEFSAALFKTSDVRRYLRRLRAVQERLGAINDIAVAMEGFGARKASDPHAWFALGWLATRREVLIDAARPELKAFGAVKPFWKRS